MTIRGFQVGGTTTVVIDGDDLGEAPTLLLPFPAKQTLGPKSTDKQATFEVALDGTVTPGYHHLRVVTDGGVSLPVVVGVDRLPQRPFTASTESLPVALHGTVAGSAVAETTFTGKAGQKVTVEVEAQRFGSKLRPVAHLYTAKRLQLAWSWGTPDLLGDTRLEATLPADGTYTVAVHDAEYAAAAPSFFRLKIGQWDHADRVFPPVVGKDATAVDLLGPATPMRVALPAKSGAEIVPLAWPKTGLWSGPRPFVEASPRTEIVAAAVGDKPLSLPAGSVGVSGRFGKPFAEEKYRVPVTPGTKVRFEVFAERLRSPVDAALVVRDEKGTQLARGEDSPGTLDPVLEYAVPDKVTAVVVGVIDTQGRGGPQAVYRLTVDPLADDGDAPDFRLVTPTQRLTLPAGGRAVVPVFAERRGYVGPIELTANDLPAGVTAGGNVIAADTDGALVTVTRDGPAGTGRLVTWRGRGDGDLVRTVTLKGHPLERLQPWLATEFAVAPTTAKADALTIDWRGLPDAARLVPAGKLALPVKVTRTDAAAPVRLTLLTSQSPPLLNGQPDVNRTIRPERAVELGAKASGSEIVALLPADLPSASYDVAVQAELLSPDKQRVLATAFTTVRRLPVSPPVALKLDGPAERTAKLDPKAGATVEIRGEIVRATGFAGEVAVALTGLPAGVKVPPVTLKAGETKFALKLPFPAKTPAGPLSGLKLTGSVITNPRRPTAGVKSVELDLALTVLK